MNYAKKAWIVACSVFMMANTAGATPLMQFPQAAISSAEPDPCGDTAMPEIRSFGNLPEEIKFLLRRRNKEFVDIADAGESFNSSDIVLKGVPNARFSLATLNTACADVAVEIGGIGLHFELFIYRRSEDGWYLFQRRSLERPPRSALDIREDAHALTGRVGLLPLHDEGW